MNLARIEKRLRQKLHAEGGEVVEAEIVDIGSGPDYLFLTLDDTVFRIGVEGEELIVSYSFDPEVGARISDVPTECAVSFILGAFSFAHSYDQTIQPHAD